MSNKYQGDGCYNKSNSSFLVRFASLNQDKEILSQQTEKESFSNGYKAGMLKVAHMNKLNLTPCGLERYVEASNNNIWKRDGDNIIRVDQDLDWIDEILQDEK